MKERIKIFVDGYSFDKEFQGVQVFISGLYQALSESFPAIEVYVGTVNKESVQKRMPFIPEQNILLYRRRKTGLQRYISDIPALLKEHRFDFAHFQYISPLPSGNCRYIVTLHDVLFNDFRSDFPLLYRYLRNLLFRKSIRNAWLKTTVSSYSRSRIAFHYGIPASSIHVLPNAAADRCGSRYTYSGAKAHIWGKYGIRNFILYVSRIEPRKNQLMLLKQYLEMKLFEQGISLVFIGCNSIPVAGFESLLGSVPAEQARYIHWLPQVEQEDMEAFYSCCRLFVYPSRAEGFGIPPLEAAVCKAPVLCSSSTAMTDYTFFDPHRFDAENEAEMTKKMMLLLDNPPAPELLQNISEKVREQYSWQRTAAAFYDLLTGSK